MYYNFIGIIWKSVKCPTWWELNEAVDCRNDKPRINGASMLLLHPLLVSPVICVKSITFSFGSWFLTYKKQIVQNVLMYVQSPFKISHALFLSIRYFSLSIMKIYRLFIAAISSHSLQDSHIKSIFVCMDSALWKIILKMSISGFELTENQKPCIASNGVIFIQSF